MRSHRFGLLLGRHFAQGFCEAGTNNYDISLLEGHALLLRYRFYLADLYPMRREWGIFNSVLIRVCFVVDQNSASYKAAAFVPVWKY
jgi:hypothetical protein